MSLRRKLSLKERAVVGMFNLSFLLKQGHKVAFAEELVRQHGLDGLFKQSKKQGEIWTAVQMHFGEKLMHLVSAFSSFWNGCDYCASGNLYAYNLHVFKTSQTIFPIDETEVPQLLRMRDTEVMALIEERLGAPEYADVLRLLRRLYELKIGVVEPTTEEDRMLIKAGALYDWVNECSIAVDEVAPPLGTIGKDKKLMRSYNAARAEQRAERGIVAKDASEVRASA